MYQTHKTYISKDVVVSELINENCSLLLMLEFLEIDFLVYDKTVGRLCEENLIDESVFILIGNLYNGFYPGTEEIDSIKDLSVIIKFLKNSHKYYKNDKYPEIQSHIKKLHEKHNTENIELIEKFFTDYFNEVTEHMDYEDEIAFPYFSQLIDSNEFSSESDFSVNEYREHHSDIETKLTDLKNLLLKHIIIKDDLSTRRKFMNSLFELEFDLSIHAKIEEKILLPLIEKVENRRRNG